MAGIYHQLRSPDFIKNAVIILLMLAACLIIYSNSLRVPFTFDDRPFIVNDTSIHLTEWSLPNLFKASFEGAPRHRPFSNISFAVNYYFSQLNPRGYHLVNIFIHFFSGVFLFFLVRKTIHLTMLENADHGYLSGLNNNAALNSYRVSAAAVMIWMVHPLHTESVTYVCQRMTSLAGMFYVFSMLLYVHARQAYLRADKLNPRPVSFFAASAMAGAFSVLSKPNAATLPVMILFYEWFFFQNLRAEWLKRRFIWIAAAVCLFFVFSIIFLGNTPIDRVLSSYSHRDFTLLQRLLTEFRVVIYYLPLIIFPYYKRLNLDYGYPISDFLTVPPITFIAISAILVLIYGIGVFSKKNPIIGFGILWFLVNLLIESSVIGLEIIFEHRTYLPSMFLIFSMVTVLSRFIPSRKLFSSMICLVILLFGYWTWQRNEIWQNELNLWNDCAVKSPEKVRPHYNLGCLNVQQDEPEQSIPHFYKALALDPRLPDIHYNLGCALAKTSSPKKAMMHLIKTLDLDPDHADAHTNLANLLSGSGKPDLAIRHYRRAAELRPKNADFLANLGAALFSEGIIDEAIEYYQKAYQLAPEDVTILNRLGYALYHRDELEPAMDYYQKALKLMPNNGETHGKVGDLLLEKADYKNAIKHYIKALEQNSEDAQSHYNLAIAYFKNGRTDQARKHFQIAARISPQLNEPGFMTNNE